MTATPSKPQFQKLTKAVEKAERLLAQDVRTEARQLTACKGLNNPDLVMPAYGLQAQKWQKQAEQMNKAAGRLDGFHRAANTPDESRLQLSDLAGRLREQAATLVAKAQELTSPQTRWSLIKAYARPQASQVAELLEAGEVSRVGRPKQLRTGPQSSPIFEVEIKLKNDADGTSYRPVWLHLHARNPMSANAARTALAQDFEAVHLKSDVEKNLGPNWVAAQRASGRYDAAVHRSPVGAELLQGLLRLSH